MDNDIIFEGSTATWRMPLTLGEYGGTYTGTFVFRCYLDPLRQLQAGRDYRDLLGSLGTLATETEGNMAFALSQLKHRIISSPPFWSSTLQESGIAGNVGDLNVIALTLDSAIRAETLYKEKIAKERETVLNRSIKVGEDLLHKDDDAGLE